MNNEEKLNFGGVLLLREDITEQMWTDAIEANFGYTPGAIYTRVNTDRKYEFLETRQYVDADHDIFLAFREIDSEYEDNEAITSAFVANLYFDRGEGGN